MTSLPLQEAFATETAKPDDEDFAFIADLAIRTAGLCLPPSKAPMVRARLQRRLRHLDIPTITDYCEYLRGTQDAQEIKELITVLTTNVTNFYREKHHFDFLCEHILPGLISTARNGGRVRLWSAGCSSGEEPVSIALDVLTAFPDAAKFDFRILATDIDSVVLQKAKKAIYPKESLKPVFERHKDIEFETVEGNEDQMRIPYKVLDLISYRHLNLMQTWPMSGVFQAVFCRNVVIYFNMETQQALWPRFRSVLDKGGCLFLGHSERLEEPHLYGAESAATTVYRFK